MTRAYVRLDPFLPEHKADPIKGEDYPDGAGWSFTLTLCWAARQAPPGYFASLAVLKALLRRRGRWVTFLQEHQDIELLPDGRVYVPGWAEWQEGKFASVGERVAAIEGRPRTGAERQAAYRARQKERDARDGDAQTSRDVTTESDGDTSLRKDVGVGVSQGVGVGHESGRTEPPALGDVRPLQVAGNAR
jgi:hypothetical protein